MMGILLIIKQLAETDIPGTTANVLIIGSAASTAGVAGAVAGAVAGFLHCLLLRAHFLRLTRHGMIAGWVIAGIFLGAMGGYSALRSIGQEIYPANLAAMAGPYTIFLGVALGISQNASLRQHITRTGRMLWLAAHIVGAASMGGLSYVAAGFIPDIGFGISGHEVFFSRMIVFSPLLYGCITATMLVWLLSREQQPPQTQQAALQP
jgi:hypothetical protein